MEEEVHFADVSSPAPDAQHELALRYLGTAMSSGMLYSAPFGPFAKRLQAGGGGWSHQRSRCLTHAGQQRTIRAPPCRPLPDRKPKFFSHFFSWFVAKFAQTYTHTHKPTHPLSHTLSSTSLSHTHEVGTRGTLPLFPQKTCQHPSKSWKMKGHRASCQNSAAWQHRSL